ncbi:MAG: phosphopantetheine-binding protein, partial [Candidatus Aminicenantes bacterium]|nr:phosphopantetheine-binding protein [Candidatus Aminicenantes bacterium]
DIRNTLGKSLPDYMVPLQFIPIEKIPVTPNGKVDKRELLAITSDTGAIFTRDFIAPKSNTEKIIARIWKEILELEKVGVTDNFFEIGGTSLDIIRVTNRMKESLSRDIPMVHIFQYPNIGALAEYFDREESENGFSGDNRLDAVERGKMDRMRRLQKKRGGSK